MDIKHNEIQNGRYIRVFIVCALLSFNAIMSFGSVLSTNETNTYIEEDQELVVEADTSTAFNETSNRTMIAFVAIFAFMCFAVFLLIKSNNLPQPIERPQNIDSLRAKANEEKNQLKKKIMNDHIGFLMQQYAKDLEPFIMEYEKKVSKKHKPENEQKLQQYKEELKDAQETSQALRYDVMDELTSDEKEKYMSFCLSFKSLQNCKSIWRIMSEEQNTDLKSRANVAVERHLWGLEYGKHDELGRPYEIPCMKLSDSRDCFFYPRFVIVDGLYDTFCNFDVIPIDNVKMIHSYTKFEEDWIRPSDAEMIGKTYQYVNKDGSPDRRYSDNIAIPIMKYGIIRIEPFNTKYMISNDSTASKYCESFESLKSNCAKAENFDFHSNRLSNCGLDTLFSEAARIVVINQQGSTSLIMRKLTIGYERAGNIMDQLENFGIVGPYMGSKGRDVLIPDENSLNKLLETLDDNADSGNTSNYQTLTETLFNDYRVIIEEVRDMCAWMKSNDDFKTTLSKQHITIGGQLLETDDLISMLIEIDFLKCLMKLGKKLDFDDCESFGLFMLFVALNSNNNFKYSEVNKYKERFEQSILGIYEPLKIAIEKNPEPEGGFMVSYLLGEVDKKMQMKYLIALHKFATIVAGIDNKMTDEERAGIDYVSEKFSGANLGNGDETNISEVNQQASEPKTKKKTTKLSSTAAEELQKLIGLDSVKAEIQTLMNFIKIQQTRQEKGMKTPPVSYHCVFTGNPGTGKTTVARIVAQIYKELGILKKGHLVETDRSGLVAEYVGQTAVKTNKILDSALDGVLFIDEAYSLVDGGQSDYGKEAISTLLKRMEDDRNRLVVILAGYTNDMKRFIDSNPGLQSRFNRYIEFPDYTADELLQIFEFNLKNNEYCISDEARTALAEYLQKCVNEKDERFGNGRFVRNLFEKTIERQANRLSQAPNLTAEMLTTIEVKDLPE